jgi:hypothetical protein
MWVSLNLVCFFRGMENVNGRWLIRNDGLFCFHTEELLKEMKLILTHQ